MQLRCCIDCVHSYTATQRGSIADQQSCYVHQLEVCAFIKLLVRRRGHSSCDKHILLDIAASFRRNVSHCTPVLHGCLSKPAVRLVRQRHKNVCVRIVRAVGRSLRIIARPRSSPHPSRSLASGVGCTSICHGHLNHAQVAVRWSEQYILVGQGQALSLSPAAIAPPERCVGMQLRPEHLEALRLGKRPKLLCALAQLCVAHHRCRQACRRADV